MRKILTVLVLLSCIGMLILNEMSYRSNLAAFRDATHAERSNLVITNLLLGVANAESSQRSFMLTGDKEFHNDFIAYMIHVDKQLASIESLIAETPQPGADAGYISTLKGMQNLVGLIRDKKSLMQGTLDKYLAGDTQPWVRITTIPHKKRVMTQIRAQGMQLISFNTLRIQRFENRMQDALTTTRITMGSAILLVIALFLLLWRETNKHQDFEASSRQQLADERNKLDHMVQERTSSLRKLAANLQQVRENERARLSRELHDELGALLTAAKLDVARLKSKIDHQAPDIAERLRHLNETLNSGIALKRRIIEDLRPSSLSNLGLVASLEILTREFADRSGVEIETSLEPVELDEVSELTIYRMVQEALTNIGKYANATKVIVRVKNYTYHAEVTVQDNGVGFDATRLPQASHGLVGMRHRVEASGGRLDINSRAGGGGSRITGTIPRAVRKPQSALAEAVGAMSSDSYKAPSPQTTAHDAAI